ncbi:polysaccharide lyase family 1 protein [Sphingomonas sp. SUN039]|uniref:pectate lyase family protein n=1 Tax=Sphingomonas sp. SUN039 TaxID=2937787 RepID=UPI002164303A|nr:pectate lyase [Sphingomonas sp. SUN039]UVO54144.1 pectate lyase [Sphingomonas sp. SUN039]
MRLGVTFLAALALALPSFAAAQQASFPGAVGWAATTVGGRGGRIIRVTTLAADGPGSFKEAVQAKGPRIVVFEVGGVIDLKRTTLEIREPYLTIAGQTAPSPGITIIKGGIDVHGHDVVIRHIRVRTGADNQPKRSGWEADAFSTVGAYNVIIDHNTFSWAIDENMSASGPRFNGKTPDEWRANTSHNITFSYNLASEGLADASHPKGEHSKGSLIHDNTSNILFYRNIWAHNQERNPLFKGGARGAVINNLIYDPGERAVHYNLMALEWGSYPYQNGQLSAVGNVLRGGVSTAVGLPFLTLGGDGDLEYYGKDNIAVDKWGAPLPMFGRYGETRAKLIVSKTPVSWPAGIAVLPVRDVETHVLAHAGARPWDRDGDDIRVLFFVAEGRGTIINDEKDWSAYPVQAETRAPFVDGDWDLATMEPKSGLYPGQKGPIQEKLSPRDAAMRQ